MNARNRGFTIVEMLIALAVGMLLSVAVIASYAGSKSSYRYNAAVGQVSDSARVAIDMLKRDIRSAGYLGCNGVYAYGTGTGSNEFTPTLDINNSGNFEYDFVAQPILGNRLSGSSWTPTLDSSFSSGLVTASNIKSEDVLTIWHPVGNSVPYASATALSSNTDNPVVGAGSGIATGDIVLISDCMAADIFQVTGTATASGLTTLSHAATGSNPGNASASFERAYGAGAQLVKMAATTYYVAPSVVRSGVNSLWMAQLTADSSASNPGTVELVQGIDDMRIYYGVDLSGSVGSIPSPTVYETAEQMAATDWPKVVDVRVSLSVSSLDDHVTSQHVKYSLLEGSTTTTSTATDNKLHFWVTTVITLRNRTS